MFRHQLIKALNAQGYKGDNSLESIEAFVKSSSIEFSNSDGQPLDIKAAYANVKKVTVTADAGEVIEVAKADESVVQEEKALRAAQAKSVKAPAVHSGNSLARKSYEAAIRQGTAMFPDADVAEAVGAYLRLKALSNGAISYSYSQRANDESIVKSWGVTTDTTGGSFVPRDMASFLITNLNRYGATRKIAGVTDMGRDTLDISDITSEAVVTWPGENTAGDSNASTPATARRQLNANKLLGYKLVSNELLNDSAVSVVDTLSNEFLRALSNKEDAAYISGDGTSTYGSFTGLASAVPSGTYQALTSGSATNWDSITLSDIDKCFAQVSSRADTANFQILCSQQFYFRVLHRLMRAAGGATIGEIRDGIRKSGANFDAMFDGYPVVFSPHMPTSASGAATVLYVGDFKNGTKFGQVRNALEVGGSEHFAYNTDSFTVRGKNRVAILCHDVGVSSTPGLVVAGRSAV